ncbi:MAG: alcohol dehydrogenase catalytic domain-containing protein [Coriobacteriales bacterium]|jgi:L-iditol 2-dehydrogenase|nr:alcohol dehydrogenase catalytic domain-containing protein [Coriobacteriales bacterium]
MRALIIQSDLKLHLEEIPVPEIQQNEILLKTGVVGLCGSDKRLLSSGSTRIIFPAVIGHEIAGTIAQVGERVIGWNIGQRVAVNSSIPCGECSACLRGYNNLCSNRLVFGCQIHGGLAEYVKIPSKAIEFGVIQHVPEDMNLNLAALAEPVAAMINAFEVMSPNIGGSVAIIGGASTAVLAAILAIQYGCKSVTVYSSMKKFRQISSLGIPEVTVVCMSKDYDVATSTLYDVIIVCADSLKAQETGLRLLGPKGKIHFFGVVPKRAGNLSLNSNDIHYLEQTVTGSFGSRSSHLLEAIKLIKENMRVLEKLIDIKLPIESYESAFSNLMRGMALKVQFVFESD